MASDLILISFINKTPYLSPGDKSFLVEKLPQMNPLDKLRVRNSVTSGQAPAILQVLQIMRAKFYQKEIPPKPNLIEKVVQAILPPKPKVAVAHSVLTQTNFLGGTIPKPIRDDKVKPFNSIGELYNPVQLAFLNAKHITFDLNSNTEQIIQNFLETLTEAFSKVENVDLKRCYFMNFVQSPLFKSYVNTGLTALRHPELEPAKIRLNLLYQINTNYLNNKQFQFASIICNHLRNLCGV